MRVLCIDNSYRPREDYPWEPRLEEGKSYTVLEELMSNGPVEKDIPCYILQGFQKSFHVQKDRFLEVDDTKADTSAVQSEELMYSL